MTEAWELGIYKAGLRVFFLSWIIPYIFNWWFTNISLIKSMRKLYHFLLTTFWKNMEVWLKVFLRWSIFPWKRETKIPKPQICIRVLKCYKYRMSGFMKTVLKIKSSVFFCYRLHTCYFSALISTVFIKPDIL